MAPKISVLMSVYQEADGFLEQAIASILEQTLQDWELIVVDDGMTESNIECLRHFKDSRIRVLTNERNQGLTRSLNIGARNACGEYLARLDSDDWSHQDRLAQQHEFLERHPEYAMCGTRVQEDFGGSLRDPAVPFISGDEHLKKTLSSFNPFAHSSLFFRRSTFNALGGYSEQHRHAQDYDLVFRMSQKGKIENLQSILTYRHIQHNQISERQNKSQVCSSLSTRLKAFKSYGGNPHTIVYLMKSIGVLVLPIEATKRLRKLFH